MNKAPVTVHLRMLVAKFVNILQIFLVIEHQALFIFPRRKLSFNKLSNL